MDLQTVDINKLKAFYFAAKAGSLSAPNIGISPSVVSRHIKDLEAHYDCQLFHRVGGKLELSQFGEILADEAEKIFFNIKVAQRKIEDAKTIPTSHFTVITPNFWASGVVIRYINRFLEKHPNIRVDIVSDDRNPEFTFQEEVAILPYVPKNINAVKKFLMSFNLKLFASKDYIKKFGMPACVEDLAQHRMVASSARSDFLQDLNWHLKLTKNELTPFIKVDNLLYAAIEGLGITTLAKENVFLKKSDLVEILPEINGPSVNAYFIYPEFLRESPTLTLFKNYLDEIIAETDHLAKY